jgi:myo-inositol-1(or 4)-monophosphatase
MPPDSKTVTSPTKDEASFSTLLDFAHTLADRAGAEILPQFRKSIAVQNKAGGGDFDPVTAADRGAEQVVVDAIAERFPDHGVVGEEFGTRGEMSRYKWVIDPIDGTRAFIMGSPLWGTLIGLLDEGQPVLGLMDQPYTRERFWSDDTGARMRTADGTTRRVTTRACASLADAVFTTTHPELFERGVEMERLNDLKSRARMTRYGGDCYGYCLLAAGFVDLIVETGLKPYDVVALIPIIEKAGGRITTWDGKPATHGGRIVATGDPALHDQVLKLLAA